MKQDLISTQEIADLCGVDVRTVLRWDRLGWIAGKLPTPGKHRRFSRELVMAWLAAGCPKHQAD